MKRRATRTSSSSTVWSAWSVEIAFGDLVQNHVSSPAERSRVEKTVVPKPKPRIFTQLQLST